MFFDACLEAVLWFADFRGLATVPDTRGLFGVPGCSGQDAAIVRRVDAEGVNLSFVGWTRLVLWVCPEAAQG